MSTGCTTIPTDGVISPRLVERNIIYSNGTAGGSGINCDGVGDSIIQDNLIYDALASGISLYGGDAATGAQNDLVVNNTILQSSTGSLGHQYQFGQHRRDGPQQHPVHRAFVPRRDHRRRRFARWLHQRLQHRHATLLERRRRDQSSISLRGRRWATTRTARHRRPPRTS